MNINKIPPPPEDDVQKLEREMAESHNRHLKSALRILAFGGLTIAAFVMFSIYSCISSEPAVEGYTKVCDIGGGASVWQSVEATDDAGLLLRSPNADYDSSSWFSGEDEFEEKMLESSKWLDGYYFFSNGKPLEVVKDEDGLLCIKLADHAACGFKELNKLALDAKEIAECGEIGEHPPIYLVEDLLASVKAKQADRRTRDLKPLSKGPLFTPSLGNDKMVFHGLDSRFPYAEIIGLQFVNKEPVFIGRRVIDRKSGTPEVEISTYDFVWGDRKFKIDCNALQVSPKSVKDESEFEQMVKPFPANICTRELEIGLDRQLELYTKSGKAVKKRTLYFTVQGERYPATERKEK